MVLSVHLVEHVIPEQFQEITFTILYPCWVLLEFWSLVDEIQLRHQTEEPAILDFPAEFAMEVVVQMQGRIEGCDHLTGDGGNELVNVFVLVLLGAVQPDHRILKIRLVKTLELIHSLGEVLRS